MQIIGKNMKPKFKDDLWAEICNSADVIKSFRVLSRKKNISMIAISQSFFAGGEGARQIRNNW